MRTNLIALLLLILTSSIFSQNFKDVKRLAEKGEAEAQSILASMYYKGVGTEKNFGKVFEWAKKSAEQGHAKAQLGLAWMYFNGDGIKVNKKKAAYWTRKSYENGYELAKEFWEKNELYKYE